MNFIAVTQIISGGGHKLKLGNILLRWKVIEIQKSKSKNQNDNSKCENVVRGFSLVLHDLEGSHYNRVWALVNEIATPRQSAIIHHLNREGKDSFTPR